MEHAWQNYGHTDLGPFARHVAAAGWDNITPQSLGAYPTANPAPAYANAVPALQPSIPARGALHAKQQQQQQQQPLFGNQLELYADPAAVQMTLFGSQLGGANGLTLPQRPDEVIMHMMRRHPVTAATSMSFGDISESFVTAMEQRQLSELNSSRRDDGGSASVVPPTAAGTDSRTSMSIKPSSYEPIQSAAPSSTAGDRSAFTGAPAPIGFRRTPATLLAQAPHPVYAAAGQPFHQSQAGYLPPGLGAAYSSAFMPVAVATPPPAPPSVATSVRQALGERGYALVRSTICRQQSQLTAQVYELHKLCQLQRLTLSDLEVTDPEGLARVIAACEPPPAYLSPPPEVSRAQLVEQLAFDMQLLLNVPRTIRERAVPPLGTALFPPPDPARFRIPHAAVSAGPARHLVKPAASLLVTWASGDGVPAHSVQATVQQQQQQRRGAQSPEQGQEADKPRQANGRQSRADPSVQKMLKTEAATLPGVAPSPPLASPAASPALQRVSSGEALPSSALHRVSSGGAVPSSSNQQPPAEFGYGASAIGPSPRRMSAQREQRFGTKQQQQQLMPPPPSRGGHWLGDGWLQAGGTATATAPAETTAMVLQQSGLSQPGALQPMPLQPVQLQPGLLQPAQPQPGQNIASGSEWPSALPPALPLLFGHLQQVPPAQALQVGPSIIAMGPSSMYTDPHAAWFNKHFFAQQQAQVTPPDQGTSTDPAQQQQQQRGSSGDGRQPSGQPMQVGSLDGNAPSPNQPLSGAFLRPGRAAAALPDAGRGISSMPHASTSTGNTGSQGEDVPPPLQDGMAEQQSGGFSSRGQRQLQLQQQHLQEQQPRSPSVHQQDQLQQQQVLYQQQPMGSRGESQPRGESRGEYQYPQQAAGSRGEQQQQQGSRGDPQQPSGSLAGGGGEAVRSGSYPSGLRPAIKRWWQDPVATFGDLGCIDPTTLEQSHPSNHQDGRLYLSGLEPNHHGGASTHSKDLDVYLQPHKKRGKETASGYSNGGGNSGLTGGGGGGGSVGMYLNNPHPHAHSRLAGLGQGTGRVAAHDGGHWEYVPPSRGGNRPGVSGEPKRSGGSSREPSRTGGSSRELGRSGGSSGSQRRSAGGSGEQRRGGGGGGGGGTVQRGGGGGGGGGVDGDQGGNSGDMGLGGGARQMHGDGGGDEPVQRGGYVPSAFKPVRQRRARSKHASNRITHGAHGDGYNSDQSGSVAPAGQQAGRPELSVAPGAVKRAAPSCSMDQSVAPAPKRRAFGGDGTGGTALGQATSAKAGGVTGGRAPDDRGAGGSGGAAGDGGAVDGAVGSGGDGAGGGGAEGGGGGAGGESAANGGARHSDGD